MKITLCESDSTREDVITSFECRLNNIKVLKSISDSFVIEDIQIRYELANCDEDDISIYPVVSLDSKYPIFDDDNWNITCENQMLVANYSLAVYTSSLDIWCGYDGNSNKTEYRYMEKKQLGCKDKYNDLYLLNFDDKRECRSPPFDPTKYKSVKCNDNVYEAVILEECQCPREYINGSERFEIESDKDRHVNSGVEIEGKCVYGGTSTVTLSCSYSGWILDRSKGACENKSFINIPTYLLLIVLFIFHFILS